MTRGLGMCSVWRVVEGWRAASDWEDSECLHGPDSYSAPFQPWESMGMFVCVSVCAWICASALALSFALQRRHCLMLGQATTNVPNCSGACTCIHTCASMTCDCAGCHLCQCMCLMLDNTYMRLIGFDHFSSFLICFNVSKYPKVVPVGRRHSLLQPALNKIALVAPPILDHKEKPNQCK